MHIHLFRSIVAVQATFRCKVLRCWSV